MTARKKLPTLEKSLNELEKIVHQLEEGQLPLEESLKLFEQGIQLCQESHTALSKAEQRIQLLIEKNGQDHLEDFQVEDDE